MTAEQPARTPARASTAPATPSGTATGLLKLETFEAFYGVSQVLHGIDLEVARGGQVALTGSNGMGKTTLLRALMRLMPQRCRAKTFRGRDMA